MKLQVKIKLIVKQAVKLHNDLHWQCIRDYGHFNPLLHSDPRVDNLITRFELLTGKKWDVRTYTPYII